MAVEFAAVSDCNYKWVTDQMTKYVSEGWEVQGVQFNAVQRNEQDGTVSVMHAWFRREKREQAQ